MSKKVSCKSCGNNFVQDSSAIAACPVCGSNNIAESSGNSSGPVWQETGVIMSFAIMLLMIIALFFLPTSSPSLEVDLVQTPEKCLFSVLIKKGNTTLESRDFTYSCDDGKTWQATNDFYVENPGKFIIKVKSADDKKLKFRFLFTNPVDFICKKAAPNPCECSQLKIVSVESTVEKGVKRTVIHANQKNCPKQYSVTGLQGPFKDDSTFLTGKNDVLQIFIKTNTCSAIAWSGNPSAVVEKPAAPAPAPAPAPAGIDLTQPMRNVIAQNNKGKILKFIDDYFSEDLGVTVVVNGSEEMTIYDYLIDRGIDNYDRNRQITVTNTKRAGSRITRVSISER